MTPAIKSMLNGMNAMISGFEDMERTSGKAIDTKSLKYARSEMAQASASFQKFEESVKKSENEQKKFNSTARNTGSSISGLAGKIGTLAGAYVGLQTAQKMIDLSDTYQQTTARLNIMNDGLQTTQVLQDKIFQSANDSHASYQATADMVSKLGLMAGDAFGNNDEIIDFAEQVSKQMVISGASASESSNAMLQLTQAMASGVLRGDELNSIFENAPTLIQSIADYLQVPIGQIRDMASDGEITADTIKKAMSATASATDAKFEAMGMTFGQAWTVFQNKSGRAFQGVFDDMGRLANSEGLDTFLNGLAGGVETISGMFEGVMDAFSGDADSGLAGFISQQVNSASSFIESAKTTITSNSAEIERSFQNANTAWDTFFTRLMADDATLKASDWGSWTGEKMTGFETTMNNWNAMKGWGATFVADWWQYHAATSTTEKEAAEQSINEDWKNFRLFMNGLVGETFTKPQEEIYQTGGSYGSLITQTATDVQTATDQSIPILELSGEKFATAIAGATSPSTSDMAMSGKNTMAGYIQGLDSSVDDVEKSGSNAAQAVIDAANDTLDINSPSKVFRTMGQYSGDGLVLGLNDRERDIANAGDSAATALKEAFKTAMGIHSPSKVMREYGYYAMDGLIEGMTGTDMLSFSNGIVADIQAAFEAGNFNLQVGTEFLGDGAKEFFQSIGVGGATVEGLIKPVDGAVTSGFGWRTHPITGEQSYHGGIDIGAAYGTPVGAAGAGEVIHAGWLGGYGNAVEIDHGNGLETLYGHLSAILVGLHQMVSAGQTIGLVGSTGNSTGPHLHFGIYQDGAAIDPGALWGYSSGTLSARSGLHLVGENGPEIVGFGGGETVLNSKKTKNLLSYSGRGSGSGGNSYGGNIYVTVKVESMSNELDVKRVGKILAQELQDSRIRTPNVQIA